MRVVLLRPPRYLWPFNSQTSAFWQPLGLISLAAAARRRIPGLQVQVWDCPGEKSGWKTLEARVQAHQIDVLGLGEEAVSAHEALRAADLVKRCWPQCLVIAGGVYFSHAVETSLTDPAIDVVVRGEGEETFADWLEVANDRTAWASVPGLAYRDAARIIHTPLRPLIGRGSPGAELDALPFPAYDLLPMHLYGHGARNHPDLVSIEHSRGCVDSCNFCILWRQMGEGAGGVEGGGEAVRPCYRTKSPQRSFEEVQRLYRDFDRRTFGWVDPTFNASADWSDGWAELMLRSDLMDGGGRRGGRPRTIHTAWMRADGIVRDHKNGVLAKLVRAGLRQAMIGVERDDAAGMAALGKHAGGPEICREAFAILREHYPEVYRIGSVIYGLPGDTMRDLHRLAAYQHDLQMDYCFLIPLTPYPGTSFDGRLWTPQEIRAGALAGYDFHTPVRGTDAVDTRTMESIYWKMLLVPSWPRLRTWWRQMVAEPDARKRGVNRALLAHGVRIATRQVTGKLRGEKSSFARRPSWYET